jgi:phospholipid/cholesterol/gamma-HCH transport system substrate-binding protein
VKATIAKLVVFAVVCAVFTGYLAFTIGNIHLFEHNYTLHATFDDVTGLLPDDNVKVAGVVVGKVTGVKIVRGRARVSLQVHDTVRLPSDSQAAVRWRNLLGQRYVYLYPGTASTVIDHGGDVKLTRSVVDIGELFNRLGPIVASIDPKDVNTFLDTVVGALDGNQQKLSKAIDDLATLAGGLGSRDAAIGRLITNLDTVAGTITDRDREIRTVLDNLVLISQTFSDNTKILDEAVTNLGDYSGNLEYLLSRNHAQINDLLTNLRTLTDLVHAKLPQLDSALGGLDQAAQRLFNASRYGDWLNQTIPCGAAGYTGTIGSGKPLAVVPNCAPTAGANSVGPARPQGAAAVTGLLSAALAPAGGASQ